jgi:CubicO group peptidase (beta-lactamase class C family)
MKKYYLLTQIYPLLLVLVCFTSCNGQVKTNLPKDSPDSYRDEPKTIPIGQTTYSKEVEEQIKQVQNNLAGRVKVEGEHWNILDRMAYYKFNGVSIAVIQNYKVVWARGYGWADVKEKRPVTENTLFQVASVSKSINSMGVLKLAQDKKIDLNTDINQYLTSWKFPYDSVSHGKKITTLNLLTHTGGITSSAPEYVFKDTIPALIQTLNGEASPSRFVYSTVVPARSITEPNVKFQYSNNGIGITQLMVSDITNKPYEQYISEVVFKPLGMMHSCYTADSIKSQKQILATGYLNGVEIPGKHVIIPTIAAGGLWTTPTDLAKFIIELQLSYQGKSNKVLSQEMAKRMLTPYIETIAPGVFLKEVNAGKYFEHSGSLPGFNSQYYGSMEGGNGVAVIVNSGSSSVFIQEIINSVATVYNWKDFYQPIYKKAISVSDSSLQKYVGVYTAAEDRFTIIVKKEDGYSLFADGTYDKMYFTNETDFFNAEFPTEKHFLKDASGNVTGYSRTLNGIPQQPSLVKVLNPAKLAGNEDFFGTAGWTFLENKNYDEAIKYLKRGMDLYPNSLMMEMNLAHCYLFKNDYADALKTYKAHLNEIVTADIKWQDMIKSDFVFFKNNKFDKRLMDKIFADLKLEIPEGYE